MENGDKVYVHSQTTGTVTEGGNAFTYEGTWSWTDGTGRFKGIKGTSKGSGTTDSGSTSQIDIEYRLPDPAAPGK
jgi:hypothetical protein